MMMLGMKFIVVIILAFAPTIYGQSINGKYCILAIVLIMQLYIV